MCGALVSVVVPMYAKQDYLPATLDSIVSQDHAALEVICVDDDSPDDCAGIVRERMQRDRRIRLFELRGNRGAGYARNYGAAQARGQYIQFFDADDVLLEGALSQAVALACEHDADVVQSMFQVHNTVTGVTVTSNEVAKVLEEIRHRVNVVGCVSESVWAGTLVSPALKLIRADFLRDHGLWFNEALRVTEDLDWAYRVAIRARKIVTTPFVAFRYMHYPVETLSKKRPEGAVRSNREFFDVLVRTYEERYRAFIATIFAKRWEFFLPDVLAAARQRHPGDERYQAIVEIFGEVARAKGAAGGD